MRFFYPVTQGNCGDLAGEVSRRKYPKALRPQAVTRADGAHMTWDKWLKSPSLDMDGLLFEDGVQVGRS